MRPGILLNKLEEFKQSLRFSLDVEHYIPSYELKLEKTVNNLRKKLNYVTEDFICPPSALEHWEKFLEGNFPLGLSRRDIKFLARDPSIAFSDKYLKYLQEQFNIPPMAVVRSLVPSYAMLWEEIGTDSRINQLLRVWVKNYGNRDPYKIWASQLDSIISESAATNLAATLRTIMVSFEDCYKGLRVPAGSSLINRAFCLVALKMGEEFEKLNKSEIDYLFKEILQKNLTEQNVERRVISSIILSKRISNDEMLRQNVINYALTSSIFGDPRIQPRNWEEIKDAKRQFMSWLSAEDIQIFFEIILTKSNNRKRFWLQYLNRISISRVFVNNHDRLSKRSQFQQLTENGRLFGSASGGRTSIFVLVLGKIIAVEFSDIGSVYLYNKEDFNKLIPDLFVDKVSVTDIKSKKLALETFPHIRGWEEKLKAELWHYGIYPV